MIPLKALVFLLFLLLLAGALLTAGFVTNTMSYVYGTIGIIGIMLLYVCIYCLYKNSKKEVPIIRTEQPVLTGMKKNKSDSNLELLESA
jgi:uncharacterized membrane protein YkvI